MRATKFIVLHVATLLQAPLSTVVNIKYKCSFVMYNQWVASWACSSLSQMLTSESTYLYCDLLCVDGNIAVSREAPTCGVNN
jgi:hypothetical protein